MAQTARLKQMATIRKEEKSTSMSSTLLFNVKFIKHYVKYFLQYVN